MYCWAGYWLMGRELLHDRFGLTYTGIVRAGFTISNLIGKVHVINALAGTPKKGNDCRRTVTIVEARP